MANKIIMPQGGQDLKFGTVVRWLKKEGDAVEKGELICEVETEKAVFEVNAPCTGFLIKIIIVDGEEAEILSPIGYIGEQGEQIEIIENEVERGKDTKLESVNRQTEKFSGNTAKIIISPKARKLAQDHEINIETLVSSRADGKITTEDVQTAIDEEGSITKQNSTVSGDGELVKVTKVQKAAAHRLQQSWQQAPHIFVNVSVDMNEAAAFRKKCNQEDPKLNLSFNDMVIKATSAAIREFPEVNASYLDEDTIIQWKNIHIGIAVATERGLQVPVLENADKYNLKEISIQTKELAEAARDGKQLSIQPSRFTISNLGMYGVDQFTAIINPPESAILAIASIRKMPIVDDDNNFVVREVMQITLSMDHRIGDGVLAVNFINRIKQLLQSPEML